MRLKYLFILMTFAGQTMIANGLTCADILQFSENKKITLSELQTIPPSDIIECLAHLGRERMANEEALHLWQSIVLFYGGIANIPESVLTLLHWITPALTPEEYQNITFTNIEVVQNFGLNYHLSEEQLTAIADRVREDFGGKEPEDYTFYDLTALRQILCTFNRSEIERIRPSAYREASLVIGKLENCSADVMKGFAHLAIQPRAFGSPKKWSKTVLRNIGKVADYLPNGIVQKISESDI